jgi:hypothetical protein
LAGFLAAYLLHQYTSAQLYVRQFDHFYREIDHALNNFGFVIWIIVSFSGRSPGTDDFELAE